MPSIEQREIKTIIAKFMCACMQYMATVSYPIAFHIQMEKFYCSFDECLQLAKQYTQIHLRTNPI